MREPGADDHDWWPEGVSRDPFGDWMAGDTERWRHNEQLARERSAGKRPLDDDAAAELMPAYQRAATCE